MTPSGIPGDVSFPDPGADLSVAGTSYLGTVVPVNASGEVCGSANRTGAFICGVVPGSGP